MAEQFIGYVIAETPKALFFQDHHWYEPDWMPKSQAEIVTFDDTHEVIIEASAWICKQKGIREFEERLPEGKSEDPRGATGGKP